MPVAIPFIASAFLAAGDAIAAGITATAAAIGATGAAAAAAGSVAAAVGGFVTSLGGFYGVGAAFSAWTTALAVGGSVATMILGASKPASAGQQIATRLDPQAPLPVIFGRTGTGGTLVYRNAHGDDNRYLDLITVLSAGGPIEQIEDTYAAYYKLVWNHDPLINNPQAFAQSYTPSESGNSSKFLVGKDKNAIAMAYKLGATPETSFTVSSGVALANLDSSSAMSGLAATYTQLRYDVDAFPSGIPNTLWVVKGVKCYDPRKDSTYNGGSGSHRLNDKTTWEWTENPFIAGLAWVIGRRENGIRVWGMGTGTNTALVDFDAFVQGANMADMHGWTCGGTVNTSDDKMAVLNSILQAGSGFAISLGAKMSCAFNAPAVALDTISQDDVIGSLSMQNTVGFRDRKNTLIGQVRLESQFWNTVPTAAISSSTYRNEDSGELKVLEVQYPLVQDIAQVAMLAAMDLANLREGLQFTVKCKQRMLQFRPGQCMMMNLPYVTQNPLKVRLTGRSLDTGSGEVTLSFRSETDAKYDFVYGQTHEAPPSAAFTAYQASSLATPTDLDWEVSGTSVTSEGGSQPAIVITGANGAQSTTQIVCEYAPDNGYIPNDQDWVLSGIGTPSTTNFVINTVAPMMSYYAAISYRNSAGATSDRLLLGPVTTSASSTGTITGQGTLATANAVEFSTQVANAPAAITSLSSDNRILSQNIATTAPDGSEASLSDTLATQQAAITAVREAVANAAPITFTAAHSHAGQLGADDVTVCTVPITMQAGSVANVDAQVTLDTGRQPVAAGAYPHETTYVAALLLDQVEVSQAVICATTSRVVGFANSALSFEERAVGSTAITYASQPETAGDHVLTLVVRGNSDTGYPAYISNGVLRATLGVGAGTAVVNGTFPKPTGMGSAASGPRMSVQATLPAPSGSLALAQGAQARISAVSGRVTGSATVSQAAPQVFVAIAGAMAKPSGSATASQVAPTIRTASVAGVLAKPTGAGAISQSSAVAQNNASPATASSARYWRVANLRPQNGGYVGSSELKFYDQSGKLIAGKSPFSNGNNTDPLANINDNNLSTYWTTSNVDGTGYVGLDLTNTTSTPYTFTLGPRPGYLDSQSIAKGVLQYSANKTAWTTAASFAPTVPWATDTTIQTFSALTPGLVTNRVNARYWRIDNLQNGGQYYVGTGELQFFDGSGNLITSFDPFTNGQDTDAISALNDGDLTTYWTTSDTTGAGYAALDLINVNSQPTSVLISPRNDALQFSIGSFDVSYSTNKTTWTKIKTGLTAAPWTQNNQTQTFTIQS